MFGILPLKVPSFFNVFVTLLLVGVCKSVPYQYVPRIHYFSHYQPNVHSPVYKWEVPEHVDYSFNFGRDVLHHFNHQPHLGNFIGDGNYKQPAVAPEQRYTYIGPNGMLYVVGDSSEQINTFEESNPFRLVNPNRTPSENNNRFQAGNQAPVRPQPPSNMTPNRNTNATTGSGRRTNQLGIPSAALASLSGGGLG